MRTNFKAAPRNSPRGSEENHGIPQDNQSRGRDLNPGLPEYKAGVLTTR
jgi:hypothetical protein